MQIKRNNWAAAALWAGVLPCALAQPEMGGAAGNGFHVYSVSGSVGYSSLALPASYLYPIPGLGGDYFAWTTAAVGYSNTGPNGSFYVTYIPSYMARLRYSSLRTFDQNLNLQLARRIGATATWTFRASGDDSSIEQYLFAANSFQDSAPMLPNPAQLVVYGTRVLTFGATTGFTLRTSPRVRWSFNATGQRSQFRPDSVNSGQALQTRTQLWRGDASMGYSVSPRTEVGFDVSAVTVSSPINRDRYASVGGHIARNLSLHWFTSFGAGVGASTYRSQGTSQVSDTPIGYTYVAEARLGYRTRSQTLAGTYDRSSGDAYGFNSRAMETFMGTWTWRNLRQNWELHASGAYQRLSGGEFSGLSVRQAGGGVARALSRQVSAGLEYGFLNASALPLGGNNNVIAHGARATLTWIPSLHDAAPLNPGGGQGAP